jgi:D-alanine-D-alanine ligase
MRLRHAPKQVRPVAEARECGRVAVMLGGTSTEREISSCRAMPACRRCSSAAWTRIRSDPRDKQLSELVTRNFDRVFIALHGPGGEDGTLQGALEFLGMPYTGSGVMGSAIGMDKLRTKRLAARRGHPDHRVHGLRSPADLDTCSSGSACRSSSSRRPRARRWA